MVVWDDHSGGFDISKLSPAARYADCKRSMYANSKPYDSPRDNIRVQFEHNAFSLF